MMPLYSAAARAALGALAVAASAVALRFLLASGRDGSHKEQHERDDNDKDKEGPPARPQCPFDPSKRKGYLSWDDYFMAIAFLSSERSKDPNRQVGACLVSQNGVILGIGYNGFPRGCSDDKLPWAKKSRNGDPLETKYPYVCHAEVNAILNTNHASAAGQRLYVTMFPCNECAKVIIQAGVSEVIYFVEKRIGASSDSQFVASHKLLSMAGVMERVSHGAASTFWEYIPGSPCMTHHKPWVSLENMCYSIDNLSSLVQVRKHRPQKQQIVINFRE